MSNDQQGDVPDSKEEARTDMPAREDVDKETTDQVSETPVNPADEPVQTQVETPGGTTVSEQPAE